ncbi:unnamed protein product [Orchesella dallaii]|uniref:Uncharacterized protein n=1 Tax=Orchesella dallaii TaxID=48710 RepID=A0ABP1RWV0_9HEXA
MKFYENGHSLFINKFEGVNPKPTYDPAISPMIRECFEGVHYTFWAKGPKIPAGGLVLNVCHGIALSGSVEVIEEHWIADGECASTISDEVKDAIGGIEFEGEATTSSLDVAGASGTSNGGNTEGHAGCFSYSVEEVSFGEGQHVVG